MPYFPKLNEGNPSRKTLDTFYGLNLTQQISDNELTASENITSKYPRLENVKLPVKKTLEETYEVLCEIPIKDLVIEGTAAECLSLRKYSTAPTYRLIALANHNSDVISDLTSFISCTLGEYRQVTTMGARVIFYNSDGAIYINLADLSDSGDINYAWDVPTGTTVSINMCTSDGETVSSIDRVSDSPPIYEGHDYSTSTYTWIHEGYSWLDTSQADNFILKLFHITSRSSSTVSGVWVTQSPKIRINFRTGYAATEIPEDLKVGDAVSLSNLTANMSSMTPVAVRTLGLTQLGQILASKNAILIKGSGYIVLDAPLIINGTFASSTMPTIKREMPKVDYLVECQNRLWGCYYGEIDGTLINEIYCCALGDFKNWYKYQGLSTDSYAASVGAPGKWTGAIEYRGIPIFFKSDYIFRVNVSSSGAHQITNIKTEGVKENNLVTELDGQLYYVGDIGIYAYDATQPQLMSSKLGKGNHSFDAIGVSDHKLYARHSSGRLAKGWYVFDPNTGIWQRILPSDSAYTEKTFQHDNYLVSYYSESGETKHCESRVLSEDIPSSVTSEELPWLIEFAPQGFKDPDQKYVSRFDIRMALASNAECDFFICYDDEEYEHCGHIHGDGMSKSLRSFVLPIRPRRCDHYQFKMQGTGGMRLYSISKIYESGSDVI